MKIRFTFLNIIIPIDNKTNEYRLIDASRFENNLQQNSVVDDSHESRASTSSRNLNYTFQNCQEQ